MSRYDRQYDFGLRGYRQTTHPMMDHRYRGRPYDYGYRGGAFEERAQPEERLSHRVTARYNMDYVTGYPSRYDRNEYRYGGDHPDRIGDGTYMRRPYLTQGGTRTMRGSSIPVSYDYVDYGPNYGGRYPDEL